MLADLQGQIERITYTNDENGYTIAKVKVYGRRDLVTVVGNLLAPTPGEILKMQGEWSNHPKYGEQFRVVHYKSLVPASVYGIEKYLGSGLIKGIGPIMAKRIVKTFGKETLDVIEQEIEKLAEVEGIAKKRIDMVRKSWADQKEIRQVMLFLQSHGVSSGYATKIFKTYGNEAIEMVQENPYRLATDIFGIGFLTADRIAEKLGFAKDSELQAEAGILYVLHQLADEGHIYYPLEPLLTKCQEILEVDQEILLRALDTLGAGQKIVREDLEENPQIFAKAGVKFLLAAPTGRAAKRMSEATGHGAKTIHRLLEYSIQKGGFQKNDQTPLKCDLLVLDEASMIDTILMHHLLKAVPLNATLILVGDVNQLPSVGAGAVLQDIISSRAVPVMELNEIFRQARESLIIVNAHNINQGSMPTFRPSGHKLEDFYFIEQEEPEKVLGIILELVNERIPTRFGFDSIEDIQVLTPMHKGLVGAGNLNQELQEALNPGPDSLTRGGGTFGCMIRSCKSKTIMRKRFLTAIWAGSSGSIQNPRR
jgi:ATP-dependent exoDNAse (exonuclease V) alpha subunit